MPLMAGGGEAAASEQEQFSDLVLLPPAHVDLAAWANATDIWPHYREIPHHTHLATCLPLHQNRFLIRSNQFCLVNATGESSSRLAAIGWGEVAAAELSYSGTRGVRCLPLPGENCRPSEMKDSESTKRQN